MTRSSPDPPASSTPASSRWSREQDIAFEDALAVHDEQCKDRWEKIAALVPGKDAAEIKLHYEILVEDIECIEAGLIPLPSYVSSGEGSADQAVEIQGTKNRSHSANFHSGDANPTRKGGSRADQERRKGIAWTEEEHSPWLELLATRVLRRNVGKFQLVFVGPLTHLGTNFKEAMST